MNDIMAKVGLFTRPSNKTGFLIDFNNNER